MKHFFIIINLTLISCYLAAEPLDAFEMQAVEATKEMDGSKLKMLEYGVISIPLWNKSKPDEINASISIVPENIEQLAKAIRKNLDTSTKFQSAWLLYVVAAERGPSGVAKGIFLGVDLIDKDGSAKRHMYNFEGNEIDFFKSVMKDNNSTPKPAKE